jgi:hypothetical protein
MDGVIVNAGIVTIARLEAQPPDMMINTTWVLLLASFPQSPFYLD